MGHQFAKIAFTEKVRAVQASRGSAEHYRRLDEGADYNHLLGEKEQTFIAARDNLYMATVSETGWPYLQHRGGPKGFIRILDAKTLGFSDFRGNRQYVSTGNLMHDNRVSLFLMDYPNRRRLKLLGRVSLLTAEEANNTLNVGSYKAKIERGYVVQIDAFDWNCPAHITPRYTTEEVEVSLTEVLAENVRLRDELTRALALDEKADC